MNSLGIPQERIVRRLGLDQKSIHNHLGELPKLAFLLNGELKKGFSVNQVAERRCWPESLVWAIKMEGKKGIPKYRDLQWGIHAFIFMFINKQESTADLIPFPLFNPFFKNHSLMILWALHIQISVSKYPLAILWSE